VIIARNIAQQRISALFYIQFISAELRPLARSFFVLVVGVLHVVAQFAPVHEDVRVAVFHEFFGVVPPPVAGLLPTETLIRNISRVEFTHTGVIKFVPLF